MEKRRVVITGMGAITGYGLGADIFWDNVINGKSSIVEIKRLNSENHLVHFGGEISDFEPEKYMDPKEAKRMDRYCQFGMVASDNAISDSKIADYKMDPYRIGVIVSTAAGGFDTTEKQHNIMLNRGFYKCSPFTIPMLIVDILAGRVSIKYGFKGVNKCIASACATATHSIGDGFRSIQYGDADVMITGGAEAAMTDLGMGGFTSARTLSRKNGEPQKASRPFDKDRDGFVMAEGAGVLVLEELEHAKKRDAKIYAEIVGYGQTADAYDIVAPDSQGNGAQKSMEIALKDGNIKPEEIDYINAHGTSTGLGDIAESNAIARLFGDVTKNKKLSVSSTKSIHGHLLGASGGVEAIVCINSIRNGIVPATINLDNVDENVANLDYVPHKAKQKIVNYALSNSFGFGGHNATLIFKKYCE